MSFDAASQSAQVKNKRMQYPLSFVDVLPSRQIFARPEATAAGHTQYAANITGEIVKFFEDYLEIEYQQRSLRKT